MQKIDKLLSAAKYKALLASDPDNKGAISEAISRMTTEQLCELVYDNPSEKRIKELFASVGGLHLLESR